MPANQASDPNLQSHLQQGHCVPCEGGVAPLSQSEEDTYLTATPEWELVRTTPHHITRSLTATNFTHVVSFINQIAQLAEEQGHHPDLHLTNYKHLSIELSTHAIGGLSPNDFIMAAKIDQLWQAFAHKA